jgi:hypothetical protein
MHSSPFDVLALAVGVTVAIVADAEGEAAGGEMPGGRWTKLERLMLLRDAAITSLALPRK